MRRRRIEDDAEIAADKRGEVERGRSRTK